MTIVEIVRQTTSVAVVDSFQLRKFHPVFLEQLQQVVVRALEGGGAYQAEWGTVEIYIMLMNAKHACRQ